MDNESKGWIVAVKTLQSDPAAKVLCPTCNSGFLVFKDVYWEDRGKCDRYITCNECGATNVVTFQAD